MQDINALIESLAKTIPLELYVPLGAFLEEVIPPIPSPIILISAGTIAAAQGNTPHLYLLWLALLGAFGKVLGSIIVYYVTKYARHIVIGKFGKFVGVSEKDITGLGKRFQGGWKDDVVLFLLRATPVIPSSVVSVMSGAINLNFRTYVIQTILGTIVRNLCFLYMGVLGETVVEQYLPYIERGEDLIKYGAIAAILLIGLYFVAKKYKDKLADRIIGGDEAGKDREAKKNTPDTKRGDA
jgi:membrane protein DedA with SNARE-associated domain